MTKRIVEIIPTLVQGGAEKQLALLAQGLTTEFDVHVCTLTGSGPWEAVLRAAEIPIHSIQKRWKIDPGAFLRLRKLLQRLKPDLVHTWLFAANSYGRQAAFSSGVPHVVAGERCVDRWKVWHELAIDRYLARRTDRIVTNSRGVQAFYQEQGIPADKFTVIPNGIEAISPAQPGHRQRLADAWGIPASSYWIVAVGRLWPQKRYKDLLWACELMNSLELDFQFLIVGEGPQQDALIQRIDDLEVAPRVHLLGHQEQAVDWIQAADCFWLGSGYEGQSNALMEAMACGKPVVATDIAGNRDLVVPDQSGVLVPVGDAAAFARETRRLIGDPQWAETLGQNARQRMQTEFTVEQMIKNHIAFYRELVENN